MTSAAPINLPAPAPTVRPRGIPPLPLLTVLNFFNYLDRQVVYGMTDKIGESFNLAKQRINDALQTETRQRIGGDEQRVHSMDTNYSALTYKHVLLPIWIMAYRYSGKSYRVVVNAMTGQVSGERPYSAIKIALAVIAGLIGLLILYALSQGGGGDPQYR
jgi:hypothetical protein